MRNVWSFRGVDCNADHYLVAAKAMKTLVGINKQQRGLMWRDLILKGK